jgi:hypothetical protein
MQTTKSQWTLFVTIFSIALFAALSMMASGWQTAQADDGEWVGAIEQMPAGGLIGDWVVRGRTFTSDAATEFRTDKGPLVIGACVEVEFSSSAPTRANKIATKNSDDCNAGATPSASPTTSTTGTPGATASATPSVSPTGTNEEEEETTGLVERMPSPGLAGEWVIDGVEYAATTNTRFRQEDGPLVVGACVEVKFSGATPPFIAQEIKTEKLDDCLSTPTATPSVTTTPDGTVTPSPTSTPDELEAYGLVETMPDGLVGDWVISGVAYSASAATEFKSEHGPFAVGVCVKVHASGAAAPFTLREIETKQAFRCNGTGGGDDAESELFGQLQSFPTGLIGDWNVGGMTFVADATTEFKQEHGSFAVGVTVKVHFTVGADGRNHAREIETKFANDDDGNDDDGNGSFEGAEGHAFGQIETFPANLTGDWTISGVVYVANTQTRFEQNDGAFAVGVRVKVEYVRAAQGQLVAQKIETTSDNGGATGEDQFVLFGFVSRMPPNGFVGEWLIDNTPFAATAQSQFKENNGLLGLGAFVKVEYSVQDGRNQVHEIETHVPPGAGDETTIGVIDDKGGAVQSTGANASVWVIGGVSYTVMPATNLNDRQGALIVGNRAWVNSYQAADGSQVATQIRGITLDRTVLLPLVTR